jgi:integrase/recombinase XerD
MRAEGLASRTITERTRIVRAAAATIGREPDRFTTDDLLNYLAALPSASTRQAYFSALRAWHRWLCAAGHRVDDPMAGLPRPRAPRRQPHPVATAHIERLLASGIRRRTRTALLLCAYQGLRVHEAAKIRGEDVDLIAHTLRVVGKGGVVAAEAEHYPRRGYWFPSYARPSRPVCSTSLSAVISRAMQRAGVPGTAHSLRHWFGTELLRGGADARTVQTLMRHASLATTALYTLVNSDQQRAALHLLPLSAERTA